MAKNKHCPSKARMLAAQCYISNFYAFETVFSPIIAASQWYKSDIDFTQIRRQRRCSLEVPRAISCWVHSAAPANTNSAKSGASSFQPKAKRHKNNAVWAGLDFIYGKRNKAGISKPVKVVQAPSTYRIKPSSLWMVGFLLSPLLPVNAIWKQHFLSGPKRINTSAQ